MDTDTSEFDSLRDELISLGRAMDGYAGAVNSRGLAQDEQIAKLWDDNAALRDDLHAVANRLETLTRAFMVDAAEVAEKMVASQILHVVKPYDQEARDDA